MSPLFRAKPAEHTEPLMALDMLARLFRNPTLNEGTVALIRKELQGLDDWLYRRYCTSCHARFILYKNGREDCPHLREEVRRELGGYA
jgi:hypothetical protein